jgi:hypothetical protein
VLMMADKLLGVSESGNYRMLGVGTKSNLSPTQIFHDFRRP